MLVVFVGILWKTSKQLFCKIPVVVVSKIHILNRFYSCVIDLVKPFVCSSRGQKSVQNMNVDWYQQNCLSNMTNSKCQECLDHRKHYFFRNVHCKMLKVACIKLNYPQLKVWPNISLLNVSINLLLEEF